jgi:hypothetical protein
MLCGSHTHAASKILQGCARPSAAQHIGYANDYTHADWQNCNWDPLLI